jgi:DNA phosphorothioation-associated putative methyltransferase
VFFALNLFERRRSVASLSPKIQRDIKAFYGTYKAALENAKPTLFSAGRSDEVLAACLSAEADGLGHMDGQKSFSLSVNQIDRLPSLLRIYIGCASQLYGDIDSADLVKIHVASAKLTLTRYDDFTGKAIPLMLERIKIDMRGGKVDFFKYGNEFPPHPLYQKSRFMNRRSKAYRSQKLFDDDLAKVLPYADYSEHGPSEAELKKLLTQLGKRVKGFELVS